MRSSEPRWGNLTESFASRPPLLEFSWIVTSPSVGSAQSRSMTGRPSRDIVVTSNSLLRLNRECTPSLAGTTLLSRSGHGTRLNWLCNVLLAYAWKINGGFVWPSSFNYDHPGGRLPPFPLANFPRSSTHGFVRGPVSVMESPRTTVANHHVGVVSSITPSAGDYTHLHRERRPNSWM